MTMSTVYISVRTHLEMKVKTSLVPLALAAGGNTQADPVDVNAGAGAADGGA